MGKDLLGLGHDDPPARAPDEFAPDTPEQTRIANALFKPASTQTALYPSSIALQSTFQAERDTLRDAMGLSETQLQTREDRFTTTLDQAGLDPYLVGRSLYGLLSTADIAAARNEDPPDAEQVQAWTEESRRAVRGQYGDEEGHALIERAVKFVKQHPQLAALLQRDGLGSRPDVVQAIVAHVRDKNFR